MGIKDSIANHTNDLTQSYIPNPLDNSKINDGKSSLLNQSVNITKDVSGILVNQNFQSDKEDIMEMISNRKIISEEETALGPRILIEQIQGNLLNVKSIEISASGIANGRGAKDGVTIFGVDQPDIEKNKFDIFVNYDYNLVKTFPYICSIYYRKEEKQFYIKAYQTQDKFNKILFIKLDSNYSLVLEHNEIISAGNTLFQIAIINENNLEITDLSNNKEKRVFTSESEGAITIGRNAKCTYAFANNKHFSRIQTSIVYNKQSNQWTIIDGSEEKPSTNGTWVFGTHSFLIKNKMTIEILSSKFHLSINSTFN